MLNIFEFPHVKEIVDKIFDRDQKTNLVTTSLSYFSELL